jgi:hypothetical protein
MCTLALEPFSIRMILVSSTGVEIVQSQQPEIIISHHFSTHSSIVQNGTCRLNQLFIIQYLQYHLY